MAATVDDPMSVTAEPVRTGLSVAALRQSVLDHLELQLGRRPERAEPHDWYLALALSVRDRLVARWLRTQDRCAACDTKVTCYFSAEFLIGPQLGNNLQSLDIREPAREALRLLGQDLDALIALEEEPGLGTGGLGRLAACFLDSLATLDLPAIGYGIRYEFGLFDQVIRDGWQVEVTDNWLGRGSPWEIVRTDRCHCVNFGGHTEAGTGPDGRYRVRWIPAERVRGIACDIPVAGYRNETCNTLRLWKSEAEESFDFAAFNRGHYYAAVEEKVASEALSKVLYPNDDEVAGKRLRLAQEYFFASCSLQDILQLLKEGNCRLDDLPRRFAVQLNDTHPAVAVAELMRLLVDEHDMDWEPAWELTRATLAYTNHTLLPEALETWSLPLFRALLPRPFEIILEINRRFLDEVRQRYPGDEDLVRRVSLIDESGLRRVRMAHLATVGTHAVNGVSRLHTSLLRTTVLRDFAQLWPDRIHSITNGVTPRRFVKLANPALAALLDEVAGPEWATDTTRLARLEAHADDPAFRERWRAIRLQNRQRLAAAVRESTGVLVDPAALFDVQVKRIHEYKRQLLNLLHVIALYRRLRDGGTPEPVPRCFVFAGKAAPGYRMAKLIIRLINGVAEVVNADRAVAGRIRVVFCPDFNVRTAQGIYPAADLSEQISTAGKEASGTGNMKFAMNGAVTIGTEDGANVELREAVGAENFFRFGLTADEVVALLPDYRPRELCDADPELRDIVDLIASGLFARGDRELYAPLLASLLEHDAYCVLADFRSYVEAQAEVDRCFRDAARWTRMSILNTARSGDFSSDRAIREYCARIWGLDRGQVGD